MRAVVLYSGSRGNAALVQQGEDSILIDAGRSCQCLSRALYEYGVLPRDIFLTHDHADHVGALPVFLRRHPARVHLAAALLPALEKKLPEGTAVLHGLHDTVRVGSLTVTFFPTPHDSLACAGFLVEGDGVRLGYATDLGCITPEVHAALTGSDAVILEANHDTDMLKNGEYPAALKRRILSPRGHLSNSDCAAEAAALAASGTRRFLLAHLSENNNTPEAALAAVRSALAAGGYTGCCVEAAMPQRAVEMEICRR